MDKHIDLRIEELRGNLYKTINDSQLTLNIIKYVLDDVCMNVKLQNDESLRVLKSNYEKMIEQQKEELEIIHGEEIIDVDLDG